MRSLFGMALAAALLVAGLAVGRTRDHDAVVMSAADHEAARGYFSLRDQANVTARPGTDLYRFLLRQRGQKTTILLQDSGGPELSRLQR